MAIKIGGTPVIDNNRNIENIESAVFEGTHITLPSGNTIQRTDTPVNGMIRYNNEEDTFEGYAGNIWGSIGEVEFDIILTPVNVQPADDATNVVKRPSFQSLGYTNAYNVVKANTQYQVSTLENFSNTVVDVTVAGTGLTHNLTTDLAPATNYYWRHRHQAANSCFSEFSQSTEFTTRDAFGPTALGQSFDGGFYSGVINIGGGVCYYLLVAPNSTGCALCAWKTTRTITFGTDSCVNGRTNTYGPLSNATHPAGNFTATRTINGFSDWYLPAKDELNLMFTNRGSMPAGEGYNNSINQAYWSSTTILFNDFICSQRFDTGAIACGAATNSNRARAIRRYRV